MAANDAEIDAAIERGKRAASPRVVEASFDEAADEITIRFENGVRLELPRLLLQGLGDATPTQLRTIEILGPGTGLEWPKLDVAHYVPGLVNGIFGTKQWMDDLPALRARMSELGRLSAAVRTPAKAAAARENGKKGGRPKKPSAAPLLDASYRDLNGRLYSKSGDTRVSTLRQAYGDDFAAGFRGDMKLATLLVRTGASSIRQLVKHKK